MYKYMSWRILLACTVGMCCTDCIVPFFCTIGEEIYTIWGLSGLGGGGAWGGDRAGAAPHLHLLLW